MREDDVYENIKEAFNSDVANKYFNTEILLNMLENHKNNKRDNYRKIWNVYCFIKWYQVFFEDLKV